MSDDTGWTDNPTVLLEQRVMLLMAEGDGEAKSIAASLGAEQDQVGECFETMESAGLVTTAPLTLADRYPSVAVLTGIGRGDVADWTAARSAGKTQRACEAAMLSWLDAHEGERILSSDEFKGDVRARMYGEPFTEEVVMKAGRTLHENRLISGSPTNGGTVRCGPRSRQWGGASSPSTTATSRRGSPHRARAGATPSTSRAQPA